MRIAFYAPMKPPDSPVPSGDRAMARLLMTALSGGGHEVALAARLRSRDAAGEPARQRRLQALGARLAGRYVRRTRARPPQLWFTYHLYHKAPDWIGPAVCDALAIPYVVAEASHAPKRAGGPWAPGHEATSAAIARAEAVIAFNEVDMACVRPLLADPARLHFLRPFVDTGPFAAAARRRDARRARLGRSGDAPVLLAVGMMRDGAKLASYRVLGQALARLPDRDWRLVVVGDGPARAEVAAALAPVAARVAYAGEVPQADMPAHYAAADLLLWPAVGESYGMALAEAQAAGLPVVAGRCGGVPGIVRDGETGLLAAEGDAAAFAEAVAALLDAPARRAAMAARAGAVAAAEHDIGQAASALSAILERAVSAQRAA